MGPEQRKRSEKVRLQPPSRGGASATLAHTGLLRRSDRVGTQWNALSHTHARSAGQAGLDGRAGTGTQQGGGAGGGCGGAAAGQGRPGAGALPWPSRSSAPGAYLTVESCMGLDLVLAAASCCCLVQLAAECMAGCPTSWSGRLVPAGEDAEDDPRAESALHGAQAEAAGAALHEEVHKKEVRLHV